MSPIIESFTHPETKQGEVFFSNASSADFRHIEFQSKRIGTIAYDGKGNKQSSLDWFSIFISTGELKTKSLQDLRREWREKTYE